MCYILYRVPNLPKPASAKYNFCNRLEYYQQLIEQISKTEKGDRIALASMSFGASETYIKQIVDELCEAALRGVNVRFLIDSMSFMLSEGVVLGPLFYSKKLTSPSLKLFADKFELLEKLAASGGQYTVTNRPTRPFTLPVAGRSHMKYAAINDRVYVGGCNLKEADRTDLMVNWQDPKIAGWLFELAGQAHTQNQVSKVLKNTDLTMPIDGDTTLLVDAGVKNQSVIYANALRIIDEADKTLVMACQYFPNDLTVAALAKAVGRGVKVRLVYNHPSKHAFPMNILHSGVKHVEKMKRPQTLFKYELPKTQDFMHAKLLASDKACLVGSHNYVRAGVRLGTAEIALLSTDPAFAEHAIKALDEQL